MRFVGRVFEPFEKTIKVHFLERVFWNGTIVLLSIFILGILNQELFRLNYIDGFCRIVGVLSIFFVGYARLSMITKKEVLNGKINGLVMITSSSIQLIKKEYAIPHIKNLKIELNDFSGKQLGGIWRFKPFRSSGHRNRISFDFNKESISKQFIIDSEKDFYILKSIHAKIKNNNN